ncbi:hypothetical protein MTES_0379 [Microbacterium testaceum StLB037]|uniref:DUF3558 domain-containing protein n=1 Tax=Microbacterium testaceum (strain StLB037) TaxID=979556 RepID=E8NAA9_MICTS|nr:hypothetical protein [Microbacterium testaceum]BAJ73343.1 hypothetical protein MTES_0379 [Microbacterium testaceum StLB037]
MNDELTPEERAVMRSRIVGGARGIAPAGAHRNAWIAGSVAAVLVVALAGGVVATSTLSAPQIANTPSPTATATTVPTPAPITTSTPTPTTSVASLGSPPFDGSCANVVDEQALADATGHPMAAAGVKWDDGRGTVRGGLTCWWVSADEFLAAIVRVAVFPIDQEPTEPELFGQEGCTSGVGDECTRVGTVDGTRVWVRMSGSPDNLESRSSDVLAEVLSRVGAYAPGIPATPTGAWWGALDCSAVESVIDPTDIGYDSVTVEPPTFSSFPDGCSLAFRQGYEGWTASAFPVAGGAVAVPSVIAAGGEQIDVAGAREAYWVAASDGVDGGGGYALIASDGVNALQVYVGAGMSSLETDLQRATFVAERILPLL